MDSENDLRRAEELVAEGRRIVRQQKGLIIRLRAAGVDTWDAERALRLFEANCGALRNTETFSKIKSSSLIGPGACGFGRFRLTRPDYSA
jgi:hypothetical protein